MMSNTIIADRFYIACEDFVTVVVGPFGCGEDVDIHLDFLQLRGDSGTVKVIESKTAQSYLDDGAMLVTVQEDLDLDVERSTNTAAFGWTWDAVAGTYVRSKVREMTADERRQEAEMESRMMHGE